MFKWLKQLFCRHIWYRDTDFYKIYDEDWLTWTSTCRKCGNKLYHARSRYG